MDDGIYSRHGPLTDPGEHAGAFADLPDDVDGLCRVVQGILLHDHSGGLYYGAPPDAFAQQSRATLPVRERLAAILARDDAPLRVFRSPFERSVGTCRDFALMLCAMRRHKGHPARVHCGFAGYFGGDGFEDHWVCETWHAGEQRWILADAQIDAEHRDRLAIGFDPADMPRDRFLCAWEAWRAVHEHGIDAARFGHGSATGLWFIEVNLARDLLALAGQETSDWDSWREACVQDRMLDGPRCRDAQAMALLAQARRGLQGPSRERGGTGSLPPPPPWRRLT